MTDKDKAIVDSYCRVGMALSTLIRSFPQFKKDDIKAVYIEYLMSEDLYDSYDEAVFAV